VMMQTTVVNSVQHGVLVSAQDSLFQSFAVANAGDVGFELTNRISNVSDRNRVRDVASTANETNGVAITEGQHVFDGRLIVGGNVGNDCFITVVDSGLDQLGPEPNNCTLNNGSTATITSASFAFVGPVFNDDAICNFDNNGAAEFDDVTGDAFAHDAQRLWAPSSVEAWPDATYRNGCEPGTTCRLFDTHATGILVDAVELVETTHTWSAQTAEDCALIAGATFAATCTSTFLLGAREIDDDGIGNDNLLCESNEACLVAPNIGADLGDGLAEPAGTFNGGGVTSVTLFARQ
jgi:hypothetical protein